MSEDDSIYKVPAFNELGKCARNVFFTGFMFGKAKFHSFLPYLNINFRNEGSYDIQNRTVSHKKSNFMIDVVEK